MSDKVHVRRPWNTCIKMAAFTRKAVLLFQINARKCDIVLFRKLLKLEACTWLRSFTSIAHSIWKQWKSLSYCILTSQHQCTYPNAGLQYRVTKQASAMCAANDSAGSGWATTGADVAPMTPTEYCCCCCCWPIRTWGSEILLEGGKSG